MSPPYFPRGKENRNFQNLKMVGETKKKCQICGKGVKDLKRHMNVHSKERPFKCEHCGTKCKTKQNLQSHMDVHSKEKPFKCEDCGEGFTRKPTLTRHLQTHTNERPSKCEQCDYVTTFSHNLKRHIKTKHFETKSGQHSTNHATTPDASKPFKLRWICGLSYCGREFNTMQGLEAHTKVHTGEKPFKCQLCSWEFTLCLQLSKHINQFHKKNVERDEK